ncbi:hypothetical protein BCR32DRAFT_293871 [Anaeromyces robustus]|uniref:Dickkopf N-terminal cysteine-rich domain-containing protein n=1 Tax=Anaeromyces robustus TaxID=1754192 RepID=A0A1Y1X4Z6_9FUNG|nr:hypothetical protein BCR32DRAFT_293871 [Anaeromyces robustus]|eukprot:ORX80426.1 hypothetical protein BCR32DRAFT_293871 [Anaeromyces robustus]
MKFQTIIAYLFIIKIVLGYVKTPFKYSQKEKGIYRINSKGEEELVLYDKNNTQCQTLKDCNDLPYMCYVFNKNLEDDYININNKNFSKSERDSIISKKKEAGRCQYLYFCHENNSNENCIAIEPNETSASYDYIIPDIQQKTKYDLIIETCQTTDNFDKCNTHYCNNNEQCYSGICENGRCIANKNNPIIQCETQHSIITTVLECKRKKNEFCTNNEQCITGKCNNGICEIQKTSYHYIYYAVAFQFTFYLIFFVFCCYTRGVFRGLRTHRHIK